MSPIALLSVSDKTGLIPLAQALINELGFKIISSGGTAKLIESANLPVTRVADYTGFPEILEGRVKTLNPKIHGGILARRDKQNHLEDLKSQNINPIDLVVVNLYPFKQTIANMEEDRAHIEEELKHLQKVIRNKKSPYAELERLRTKVANLNKDLELAGTIGSALAERNKHLQEEVNRLTQPQLEKAHSNDATPQERSV